jgi:hypothetical protein
LGWLDMLLIGCNSTVTTGTIRQRPQMRRHVPALKPPLSFVRHEVQPKLDRWNTRTRNNAFELLGDDSARCQTLLFRNRMPPGGLTNFGYLTSSAQPSSMQWYLVPAIGILAIEACFNHPPLANFGIGTLDQSYKRQSRIAEARSCPHEER